MLKYISHILGVLTVLAILVVGAFAPPAHAASANLVLTQVQAGGVGAATQELVVIYNNSPDEVNITDWCVKNKSGVAFACFTTGIATKARFLPGYSFATISSTALSTFLGIDFTLTYTPTNQSSGAIVGSSDSISLVDASGAVIDSQSWSTSLSSVMLFARKIATDDPFTYLDTGQPSDWQIQSPEFLPDDGTVLRDVDPPVDVCPNIDGIQVVPPLDYTLASDGTCELNLPPLSITELLPNAVGADDGKEFIELYNSGDQAIDLTHYSLWVGPALDKEFHFPDGASISANSYAIFTNVDIAYSLLNTSSRVRLVISGGTTIDETPSYQDPGEGVAWALIDGVWQYTDQPTPGAENLISMTTTMDQVPVASAVEPKPCAANQYRSPDTNRCRLIATSQPAPTPCKDGQYRSEETNRCRNIAADAGPAPCPSGQERNPDTNRCRTVKVISNTDYGVLGAQTKSDSNGYLWLAIGGLGLLVLGYGVWEWRYELGKLWARALVFVRIRK
jgi:hypothetical protein